MRDSEKLLIACGIALHIIAYAVLFVACVAWAAYEYVTGDSIIKAVFILMAGAFFLPMLTPAREKIELLKSIIDSVTPGK